LKGGKLPKLDTIDEWDGQDGKIEIEEDLDDIVLDKDEL
jgi:hypothetical protein